MDTPRKKILYIITKSVWGGAQKYVYDLATHLPPEEFEVVVAAGGNGPLIQKLREVQISVIPIPHLARDIRFTDEIRSFFCLLKIIRDETPNIIHLNSTKIGIVGAVAVTLFKLLTFFTFKPRVIFTVHGWGFKEDRHILVRGIIFLGELFGSFFQDRIIVINTADHASAKKFIPRKKLLCILNGVDDIEANDFCSRAAARAFFQNIIRTEIKPDTFIIGTIAEFTRNKGLPYLMEAAARLCTKEHKRKFLVLVVGNGAEWKELENAIRARNLENIVFLVHFVPEQTRYQEAWQYMRAFDVFALPSVKEGLPYVIMEAMAAGLPVAATNVGGVPDLIENGKNGILVPPKNPEKLAEALLPFLEDNAGKTSFGVYSQEKVKTKFPLRDMIKKTKWEYQND